MIQDVCVVAFDTETSGAWPVSSEVIEFGAVKSLNGQIIDEINILFKPCRPLVAENIAIHGITNEMVESAPQFKVHADEIAKFMQGAIPVAHHAPFDMGFMSFEFERAGLPLNFSDSLCTSLLSRQLIQESENHKLQTLIKLLKFDGGTAHRALDDAKACLRVFEENVKRLEVRLGRNAMFADLQAVQAKKLEWKSYSLLESGSELIKEIYRAVTENKNIEILYVSGSVRDKFRPVKPIGIVRSPDGDYLYGVCLIDHTNKRFYLNAVKDIRVTLPSQLQFPE